MAKARYILQLLFQTVCACGLAVLQIRDGFPCVELLCCCSPCFGRLVVNDYLCYTQGRVVSCRVVQKIAFDKSSVSVYVGGRLLYSQCQWGAVGETIETFGLGSKSLHVLQSMCLFAEASSVESCYSVDFSICYIVLHSPYYIGGGMCSSFGFVLGFGYRSYGLTRTTRFSLRLGQRGL